MKYSVSARPRMDTLAQLWSFLNDGTIAKQEPDGREIISSMKRAIMSEGKAIWTETCYCNPPLQHERSTVYDKFFTDMEIRPHEDSDQVEGDQFWDYLRDFSKETDSAGVKPLLVGPIKYVPIRAL